MSSKIVPPFLRTPYNYDRDAVSDETGLRCEDVSLAVQDARDECDINTIVKNFGLTGSLPDVVVPPSYGDYTGVSDFQSAMNAVRQAAEDFMALPAQVRSRFENDPQRYLEFFTDPKNQDEAIRLGLATRSPEDPSAILARGVASTPPAAPVAVAGQPAAPAGAASPPAGG
ncbi:internal scaffolding protein VP3 [Gokushovirinae Bog5712_52]|uniref:internal scaffolding protein VP3 n=1 Tax=Gokushovirinae Bog5712_52 TaxID=1655649 RepID=UPI00063D607A|nr:internal scaffolding protein VP3 [Gokushovirinae Bog5712_52]AKI26884.1 internal scaffolding protein VP3 [Gokushovirinae Bog5712_52]